MQYRHGDLLLVRVDRLPEACTGTPGRVLAYGEATGHAHVVNGGQLYDHEGTMFLLATTFVALTHEEHARLDIPAGVYRIQRQREYSPAAPRWVVD